MRQRRSQVEIRQILADYQASGLSKRQFCKEYSLSERTFRYWSKMYGLESTSNSHDVPHVVKSNTSNKNEKRKSLTNKGTVTTRAQAAIAKDKPKSPNSPKNWDEVDIELRPSPSKPPKKNCPTCDSLVPAHVLDEHRQKVHKRHRPAPMLFPTFEALVLQHAVTKPTASNRPSQPVGKLPPLIF